MARNLPPGWTCLITGANRGIGLAAAEDLAARGAHVVFLCRDRVRGDEARARVRARTGNSAVELEVADLGALDSVRGAATRLVESLERLDALINNAHVIPSELQRSAEGFELQFAVGHLGHFLLTMLLLDLLESSAPSRVVMVSSGAHYGPPLDFGNLRGERGYRRMRAYQQVKLANLLFTYELARRSKGAGVTANAVHPGVIATGLAGDILGPARLVRHVLGRPGRGAAPLVRLAADPSLEGVTGRYFERLRETRSSDASYDRVAAERLWALSEEATGLVSR